MLPYQREIVRLLERSRLEILRVEHPGGVIHCDDLILWALEGLALVGNVGRGTMIRIEDLVSPLTSFDAAGMDASVYYLALDIMHGWAVRSGVLERRYMLSLYAQAYGIDPTSMVSICPDHAASACNFGAAIIVERAMGIPVHVNVTGYTEETLTEIAAKFVDLDFLRRVAMAARSRGG